MIRASSEPRRQGGRGRERETRTGDTHYYRVWTLPGEHRSTLTLTTASARWGEGAGAGAGARSAVARCGVTAVSRGHELEVEWLRLRSSCGHQLPAGRTPHQPGGCTQYSHPRQHNLEIQHHGLGHTIIYVWHELNTYKVNAWLLTEVADVLRPPGSSKWWQYLMLSAVAQCAGRAAPAASCSRALGPHTQDSWPTPHHQQ